MDIIAGILYYVTSGHNKPCGQSLGANGMGAYCVVITGDKTKAHQKAQDILTHLKKSGYTICHFDYIENDPLAGYYGSPVSFIDVEN